MSTIRNSVSLFVMLAATACLVVGICLSQINVVTHPEPTVPELECSVDFFFYARRTVCPNRPLQYHRITRPEGLFGCVEAYDRFIAAYSFAFIAVVFIGVASFLQLLRFWFEGISNKIVYYMTCFAFICLTICWPLSWGQVTSKQCGQYLKDAVLPGSAAYDATRGPGLNLIVSSWAITALALLLNFLEDKSTVVTKMFAYVAVSNQ